MLKIIVILFSIYGVILSVISDNLTFMGGKSVLMYFTIQSNILIALVSLIGLYYLFFNKNVPNWWYIIKFVSTISITLTGTVFCFVLAPTMGVFAWNKVNIFTHVVVPICAVLDFFVTCVESNIKMKDVIYTLIPPILYVIYAIVGYICNWQFSEGVNYPYFFLNWGSEAGAFGFSTSLPYMGCIWWILIIVILLIITGFIYLNLLNILKKHK